MTDTAQNQQLLRGLGYGGEFGAGGAQAWLAANPTMAQKYAQQQAARDQGYSGVFGQGGYDAYKAGTGVSAATPSNAGVMPIGVVEPFNQYQQQGLTSLATPYASPYAQQSLTAYNAAVSGVPDATNLFDQSQNYTQQGTRSMTDGDFNAGISRYMNPYQSQVVDSTVNQINQQGNIARNRLMAKRPGSLSFGDTSNGVQQGMLTNDLLRQVGDTTGALNYQGFNNAANMTNSQFNQDRSNNLTAGANTANQGFQSISSLAGLAAQGSNMGAAGQRFDNTNAQNQIGAGTAIQDQNQRLLDVVNNQRTAYNDFDKSQVSLLAQLLKQFPDGTNPTAAQNSGMTNAGGALMAIGGQLGSGGALSQLFGGGNTAAPWVNPDLPRY